jgi:NAD(P)H-flavin reductase
VTSSYEDARLNFSKLLIVAQNENLQAFIKVLKDLERRRVQRFKLELLYYATTKEDVLFAAELEYWSQHRRDWRVEVFVEQGETVEPFKRGSLAQAALQPRTGNTVVFASVYSARRPTLAERLQTQGFDNSNIHWFN